MKLIIKGFAIIILCLFSTLNCKQKKENIQMEEVSELTRYGSIIGVKPEYEERYIILHKHTFPGVLERIRKCNIRNYSIFLNDGLLFSHFEYVGSDFEADMANMGDETTKEWWKLTDPMQEPVKNRKEGEWWASMELLFQMDRSKAPFEEAKRFAYTGFIQDGQEESFKEELEKIDKSFHQKCLEANIQNITIYKKDNQVFLYFEYVGTDFELEVGQLEKNDEFKTLNSNLKAKMKPVSDGFIDRCWIEMTEVFHTN